MSNKFKIEITISVAIVIAIFGVFILLAYYFASNIYQPFIGFFATVVGIMGGIYAAFYVGYALQEQTKMKKLDNSFMFLAKFDTVEDSTKEKINDYLQVNAQSITPADFYEQTKQNPALITAIRARYNFFEDLSLPIQYKYVDEKILYLSMNNILQKHCAAFDAWADLHRKNYPNPTNLYKETHKLRNAWKGSTYLTTQKAVHLAQ